MDQRAKEHVKACSYATPVIRPTALVEKKIDPFFRAAGQPGGHVGCVTEVVKNRAVSIDAVTIDTEMGGVVKQESG